MNIKSFFTNIYVKNLLLIIIVSALLVIFVFWWLNIYTKHGKAVIVPNVKDITVAEAVPFLESRGLRYEVIDSIYMKNKKPGVICEQLPQEDSKVKLNRTVYLTINAFSSRQIELPDVRDLSLRQAETILSNAGFSVSVDMVESEFKDLVLRIKKGSSTVYPGTKFVDGTRLTLEVGDGALAIIPDTIPSSSIQENTETIDEAWF